MKNVWTVLALLTLGGCVPTARAPVTDTTPPAQTGATMSQALQEMDTQAARLSLDGQAIGSGSLTRLLTSGTLQTGNTNAPQTLYVFTEYNCPYCREFYRDYLPALIEEFVEPGQLRVLTVLYPLQKYPGSELAAKATLCAGQLGQAAEYHTRMFQADVYDEVLLKRTADDLNLDRPAFDSCLEDADTQQQITQLKEAALDLDVTLVPTFILNEETQVGLPDLPDMRGWIRANLGN